MKIGGIKSILKIKWFRELNIKEETQERGLEGVELEEEEQEKVTA